MAKINEEQRERYRRYAAVNLEFTIASTRFAMCNNINEATNEIDRVARWAVANQTFDEFLLIVFPEKEHG